MKLNLRWSKALAAGAVIAMFLSVAFVAPVLISRVHEYQAARLRPRPVSDQEQLEILRVVLRANDYYYEPPPPPPPGENSQLPDASSITQNGAQKLSEARSIVLIDSSIAFCGQRASPGVDKLACANPPEMEEGYITSDYVEPQLPKKLRQELVAANRKPFVTQDPHSSNVIYRPRAIIHKLFPPSSYGWDQFHALFPHSYGFVEVSRAVLSEDGTHALIYVEHHCGGLCGAGVLYYMVRTGNTWRIAISSQTWIS
jgi:hypothetical protein